MQSIVIHYSEIGTKGENRAFFENKLAENVKRALGKNAERVYRRYGRIVCDLGEGADQEQARQALKRLPGIAFFSFMEKARLDVEDFKRKAISLLEKEEFGSFKVESRRSNKDFPVKSTELNVILGSHIQEKLGKTVDVKQPDLVAYVDVGEKEAFVYCRKNQGVGGLPVGASGKVVCLLSGGIDSPVAAFSMMKRGCKVVFVHAFNKTMASQNVSAKISRLAEHLAKIQLDAKLYVVPFEKIQKKIIAGVPSQYRMVAYRRIMMKVANEVAKKEKAKAVVTGDSVGQVASQTLENLQCIYQASELPVFAPLIGTNKEEAVNTAKKIGTYEKSIAPYPDCCSFMIAAHPKTKTSLEEILPLEKSLKIDKEIADAVSNARVEVFRFNGNAGEQD